MRSKAPDFPEGAEWLNTKPLSLAGNLKGHIVVLDFWTYCCINCIHLLPDLKELEKKYKDQPVIFIGVHSAKFRNEMEKKNVESAVERYEINHPVVIDAHHQIWNKHAVNSWPTVVVIDAEGFGIYHRGGENQIDSVDEAIQEALDQGSAALAEKKLEISVKKKKLKRTLSFPGKIDIDGDELTISDSNNNRILITKVTGNKAKILHEIGSGLPGLKDGGFKTAQFNHPQGVVRKGNFIYVADTENHAIRLIDIAKKTVSTIAGTGEKLVHAFAKGPEAMTALNSPWDVLIHGDFLYIAMAGSHQIWRMNLETHAVEGYAGTSGEDIIDGHRIKAWLAQPSGLATDGNTLFFADSETSSLRTVDFSSEEVHTLIGKGLFVFGHEDGLFDKALLQHPLGVAYHEGKIYIADTYNHAIRVADLKSQTIETLISAKDQNVCLPGKEKCDELALFEPNDVVVVENKLFIADTNNHLIRIFDREKNTLTDVEIQ